MPVARPKQVVSNHQSNGDNDVDEIKVEKCVGKNAITASRAKELLGWDEETKDVKFGDVYLIKNLTGSKVRCFHNTKNRPLSDPWYKALAQDILNRNWVVNGETIIFGKSGQVLSGQHRLFALIIAVEMWRRDKKHWITKWKTEPVLETILVFGIEEDDRHTRTLDNVKPRTLADVLFTSDLFSNYNSSVRSTLSRMTDYAIRLVWQRTGAANAFNSYRTHSESIDFITRHPRLLECVKHIYEENKSKRISKYLSAGYATGLMYLMAVSETEGSTYWNGNPPSEELLSFDRWEQAVEFWIEFGTLNSQRIGNTHQVLDAMLAEETDGVRYDESIAVIVNAWNAYVMDESDNVDVSLEYTIDEEGVKRLAPIASIGGIDKTNTTVEENNQSETEEQ